MLGKVTSPEEAASLVKSGMALGIGTGNSIACPKTFSTALAKELEGKSKIILFTGGPVPYEIDSLLTRAHAYQRRFGQFSGADLRKAANDRDIPLIDTRTGILPLQVKDGRFGNIDIAAIEATAFTQDGYIIPSTSLVDASSYAMIAEKVIVEINTKIPEELEGIHDVYIPEVPPNRKPIPLVTCSDRIGTPYIPVNPDKIVAIIESNIPDSPPSKTPIDEESRRIAELLIDFFKNEVKYNRLPPNLLPLQFGIGAIPEALAAELATSGFSNIEFFTGTFGDGGLDLIDTGNAKMLSTGSMYLSKDGFDRFYRELGKYKSYIIIRP
ncbi:acetyl-CoA hydrolase, partial [Chloroflexota bacterium]